MYKNKKIRLLNKWSLLISWVLSLLGVSVGNFGCAAYGPPDDYPNYQLDELKKEISDLEIRLKGLDKEKSELQKSVDKRNKEIIQLNAEKDSLNILIEQNEK
jgi:peptidoglycan hydrolase CwlO-like protein